MEVNPALSTISTAVTLTLRITEKVYEIIAVDQEAKDLLETTSQVNNQLTHAKKLRRQKSGLLSNDEKDMVDKIFVSTERAVSTVATLVEPARADMNVNGGRVRMGTRMLFVFRDAAHIPVSLSKLGIANQSLAMAISILCGRASSRGGGGLAHASPHHTRPPPSYQESEWLYASRQQNLRRRASAISMRERSESERPASRSSFQFTIVEHTEESTPVDNASTQSVAQGDGASLPTADLHKESYTDHGVHNLGLPPERRPGSGKVRSRSWLQYQAERQ